MKKDNKTRYYLDYLCDKYDENNKRELESQQSKTNTEKSIDKIINDNFNKKEQLLSNKNDLLLI